MTEKLKVPEENRYGPSDQLQKETDIFNKIRDEAQAELKKREANKKFVSAYRKAAGVKTQTEIKSATTRHNEWAVREGWSITDAMRWRTLCEAGKFAQDDIEGESLLELLIETIELAAHCEVHPIGIICTARESLGAKTWDIDTVHAFKKNLLSGDDQDGHGNQKSSTTCVDVDDDKTQYEDEDDDSGSNGSGKKRKYEATQPDYLDEE